MKISYTIKNEIKVRFHEMQTKEDLLALLNYVKPLLYGKNAYPFLLRQLTWYYNTSIYPKKYNKFRIKKKSGKHRSIHAPVAGLKAIQRCLGLIFTCIHSPHVSSFGFETGKSIVDNAYKHVGSRYVYNIDLKDFFSSIDQARVWKCLQIGAFQREAKPSNYVGVYSASSNFILKSTAINDIRSLLFFEYEGFRLCNGSFKLKTEDNEIINYSISVSNTERRRGKLIIKYPGRLNKEDEKNQLLESIIKDQTIIFDKISPLTPINIIAAICCFKMSVQRIDALGNFFDTEKNVLPQGAPTSPILTNIVCNRLDTLLTGLAKRFGTKYSRYADDISFSSGHNIYHKEGEFTRELKRVIENQGFIINDEKTRLQKQGYRQEVTGLIVNNKVNVHKRFIKQVRTWIHLLEKHNLSTAQNIFLKHYTKGEKVIIYGGSDIFNVIAGKLLYLRMVKGTTNSTYKALNERFKVIKNNYITNKISESKIIETADTSNTNLKNKSDFGEIVERIIDEGLDEAMSNLNL